jgi:hypothetical protein
MIIPVRINGTSQLDPVLESEALGSLLSRPPTPLHRIAESMAWARNEAATVRRRRFTSPHGCGMMLPRPLWRADCACHV